MYALLPITFLIWYVPSQFAANLPTLIRIFSVLECLPEVLILNIELLGFDVFVVTSCNYLLVSCHPDFGYIFKFVSGF